MSLISLTRQFKIKDWRKRGVESGGAITGSLIFVLPAPIILLLYTTLSGQNFIFTKQWLLYSVCWLIPVLTINIVGTWILNKASMTRLSSLSMVIKFLFAIITDIYFFNIAFSYTSLIAILMMLAGGILIKQTDKKTENKNSISLLIICVIFVNLLSAIAAYYLKKMAIMQTNPLFFTGYIQTLGFSFATIMGYKDFSKNFKIGNIKLKESVFLSILLLLYCLGEPYAAKELPLAFLTALGSLNLAISFIYDIKSKEVKVNKKNIFYVLVILMGSSLLILDKI